MAAISRLPLLAALLCALPAGLRGQVTEAPDTVAPGHFLVEMDALAVTLDHRAGGRFEGVGAASTLVTTGLTADWDLQLGAQLFLSQKYENGGLTDRRTGIGDMYVRTKWRFYSDPTLGTAVAIIPYAKIPTNSGGVGNHAVEGGVIVPWTARLWGDFAVSAMAELDLTRNDADDGYDSFLFASAAVKRRLTRAIGLYGEATWGKSSGGAPFASQLGGGVTYNVSEWIQWDFAMYRGVSNGAADWNHVLRLNLSF